MVVRFVVGELIATGVIVKIYIEIIIEITALTMMGDDDNMSDSNDRRCQCGR